MNDLIIASWNVRGSNNKIAINNVRRLLKQFRANVPFLQETKCQLWTDLMLNSIWDSTNHGWISIDSQGSAGILLISWDKQLMNIVKFDGSPQWLWCKGYLQTGKTINLINIYGPRVLEEKQVFCNDLKRIHSSNSKEPICMMGDFNSIRRKEDRSGCIYNNKDTFSFNSFMDETSMLELEGVGVAFTWFGPLNKKSILDRVIVNDDWLSSGEWTLQGNHRRHSDHIPVVFSSDGTN